MSRKWESTLGEPLDLGIGINTGLAQVGNTGTTRKFKYGPLGTTVNLASRVQGATKHFKARLLITEATRQAIDETFTTRRLGKVRVVNIDEPVVLHELFADDHPDRQAIQVGYESALGHHLAGTTARPPESSATSRSITRATAPPWSSWPESSTPSAIAMRSPRSGPWRRSRLRASSRRSIGAESPSTAEVGRRLGPRGEPEPEARLQQSTGDDPATLQDQFGLGPQEERPDLQHRPGRRQAEPGTPGGP